MYNHRSMARDADEFGLLNHLDKLLTELQENVPKALKDFDIDGIHDARVATRRLKAAMELLAPVLSDDHRKEFEKVLKKIRRRLGPLRDMDVMLEHLSKLADHATHGNTAQWLAAQLEHRRDLARLESLEGPRSADVLAKLGSWWHVREEVIEAHEAIDTLVAQSLHLQFDEFTEKANGLIRQMDAAGESDHARQDPHELRIAGKLLRYTLELAESQGHSLPAAVFRQFKRMQECLGNWHDDVVLVRCAMQVSLDQMVAYHDLELQEKVLDLNRFFLRRAERELANFARLWKKRGDEVSNTVRQRVPLSESQTDHDQTGSDATAPAVEPIPDAASAV